MERSHSEERYRYRDPEIPDHDVQTGLEGKEPFSAGTGIAVEVRSIGQTDGETKGE